VAETQVIPIQPGDRARIRRFLDLPWRIYADVPQWVPPLSMEAGRPFDRARNPFYRHSDAAFFLAQSPDGEVLGRISVLENRNYNAYNHERTAFFWHFECVDDTHAAGRLVEAAAEWARARGLTILRGPHGFTPLDGLGLLMRGFEHRPAFGIPYNPPTYPRLLEAAGFRRTGEILSGHLPASLDFPERIHDLSRRVQARRGLHIARYRSRNDLRALIPQLGRLYNASLRPGVGAVPLTDDEARGLGRQLLWFADPGLIKVVMKDEEPVGFLFAYPDPSAAVQRTRGRLLPTGWMTVLRELRRTTWVNINGAGIREEERGLGGTAILFSEMHRSIVEGGFADADLVQIGAENDRMLRELRAFGVDFYKSHAMYDLPLG
jgi:GNAT superfamily N-acetyltransferase